MKDQEPKPATAPVNLPHHMTIHWHRFAKGEALPVTQVRLTERATIVGRVGLMMLACGTGAWRVREAMNTIARALGLTCSADVGLITLEYTCFENGRHYSQTLALPSSGVNTDRLHAMEVFVNHFEEDCTGLTVHEVHERLDAIQRRSGNFSPLQVGLASALACAAFVFLLGGGPIEMLCAFFGAGVGNYTRRKMIDRHITLVAHVAVSVAAACLTYFAVFKLLEMSFHIAAAHEAGYIGAMLFVIPGFPFITSGLDMAKLDMRSGLERGTFAILTIVVATLTGWVVAMLVQFHPENFLPLGLSFWPLLGLRIVASFCGVFGFSIMFNSPVPMATMAGLIGALANTLRLTLSSSAGLPPAAAAFLGALLAGLLASLANRRDGYPRISLTVPAIVIMVPGLYMYRAMFNLGLSNVDVGGSWLIQAAMMVVALPLGLAMARIITDPTWRHAD
ncbi:threonine/serine ThrE exporter family protein [Lacticaseibacillus salsurivasis]|uniref:threonine/serine ThrE exporter family protein n=1 Tax=Lacticaseibacillus salsurivasis TaxID=3081441 RepID=UPI0030C7617F